MAAKHLGREVLERWSRLTVPFEVSRSEARRRRLVEAIAGTLENAIVQRRRARRITWLGLSAAGALAAGGALAIGHHFARDASRPVAANFHVVSGTYHVMLDGHVLAIGRLPEDAYLPPEAELTTGPDSRIQLRLQTGVEIATGSETDLIVPSEMPFDRHPELRLKRGFITIDVPKLTQGGSFSVRTPDTMITVHGTSFSVEVTDDGHPGGLVTRVRVKDVLVAARVGEKNEWLHAGMQWESAPAVSGSSASPASPAPALHRDSEGDRVEERAQRESAAPRTSSASAPRALTASLLAEQNRLFRTAMDAEVRGEHAVAVGLLDDFISRYPASALTQVAHVQRFRVLARTGTPAAAGRAAAQYLSAYPHGFAVEEARALVMAMH